jgi:hypothetical protein
MFFFKTTIFETFMKYLLNMKQTIIFAIVFGLLMTICLSQSTSKRSNHKPEVASSSEVSSQITIDYSSVAIFKTASTKKEYRIGDWISIDIAMLNKSKKSIYFLDLGMWAQILAKDSNGNKVGGGIYSRPLMGPKFSLIGSGEYDSQTFHFLIGCDDVRKRYDYSYKSMKDDFDKNRFVTYGSGCIEINKKGNYTITSEISNSYTKDDKTKKTAVGTMESTPFEIKIIE